MKVGDLVCLSAYGKGLIRANWIDKEDIGIITKIHYWSTEPREVSGYAIKWTRSTMPKFGYWTSHEKLSQRKDLKFVTKPTRQKK